MKKNEPFLCFYVPTSSLSQVLLVDVEIIYKSEQKKETTKEMDDNSERKKETIRKQLQHACLPVEFDF